MSSHKLIARKELIYLHDTRSPRITPPASLASLTNNPGIGLLGIICRVMLCVGSIPAPACSLQISRDGFRGCVERRSWAGGGFCCFFSGSSFLLSSSSGGTRLGISGGSVGGKDVGVFGAAACSQCASGASSSSPSSDTDALKKMSHSTVTFPEPGQYTLCALASVLRPSHHASCTRGCSFKPADVCTRT